MKNKVDKHEFKIKTDCCNVGSCDFCHEDAEKNIFKPFGFKIIDNWWNTSKRLAVDLHICVDCLLDLKNDIEEKIKEHHNRLEDSHE